MIKVVNCETKEVVATVKGRATHANMLELATSFGKITAWYPTATGAVAYFKGGKVLGFSNPNQKKPEFDEKAREQLRRISELQSR